MPAYATASQRDFMRSLYRLHNGNEAIVCAAYVKAEIEGLIFRTTGDLNMSSDIYAQALFRDGLSKGWLGEHHR